MGTISPWNWISRRTAAYTSSLRARPMADNYIWGTGRRKAAVASVRIRPGTGVIRVNGHDLEEYFAREDHQGAVRAPLRASHRHGA